jgi:Transposase
MRLSESHTWGPSVSQIIRIGMDTSKYIFQLHGVDASERVVLRKRLTRKAMLAFFAELPATVVVIEACGAAHYLARELGRLGHRAKLIAPQLVKPYVSRNKNDGRDAEGLCEAGRRPRMRYVPVKTAEQQAALMLLGVREQLVTRWLEPAPGADSGHWPSHGRGTGDEGTRSACLPLRPAVCSLARPDPKGPFHGREDQARQDHPGRR